MAVTWRKLAFDDSTQDLRCNNLKASYRIYPDWDTDQNTWIGGFAENRLLLNADIYIILRIGDVEKFVVGSMKIHTAAGVDIESNGKLFVKGGGLYLKELSADPPEPDEGYAIIWMSDGTGYGDDGDVCIASKAGGVTKKAILFDHSAGTAW